MKVPAEVRSFWLSEFALDGLERVRAPAGSPNAHYAGIRSGRPGVFFKIMKDRKNFCREGIALEMCSGRDLRVPKLLGGGETQDLFWRALDWVQGATRVTLERVPTADMQAIGCLIGELHVRTKGAPAGKTVAVSLRAGLAGTASRLSARDRARVTGLLAHAKSLEDAWCSFESRLPIVLLHGDFGLRNVIRDDWGKYWLIDFEHAKMGPCLLDFAKLRFLGEPYGSRAKIKRFDSGYRGATGFSIFDMPETYLWGMGLWVACGILYFTSMHSDPGFRVQGWRIIEALEQGRRK